MKMKPIIIGEVIFEITELNFVQDSFRILSFSGRNVAVTSNATADVDVTNAIFK